MATEQCGQRYRRTMYEAPGSRVCTKPPHEGGRHSDNGHLPKKVSNTPGGTCQICFRSQQTSKRLLVKHGYKRPGWGYTIGECWGCRFQPFEVSCERTKAFLTEVLGPTLVRFEAELSRLAARPTSLDYTGRVWVGWAVHKSGYLSATVTVNHGEAQGYKPTKILATKETRFGGSGQTVKVGDPEPLHHPSYDDLLKREIQDCEGRIRMCKADIATYKKKVAEWKPVPWPAVKAGA